MVDDSSVTDGTEPKEPELKQRTHTQLLADIEAGRTELGATLDAIEDKLNVKKKVTNGARRAGGALRALQDEKPVVFVALGLGVAVAVGAVAWLSVRALFKD